MLKMGMGKGVNLANPEIRPTDRKKKGGGVGQLISGIQIGHRVSNPLLPRFWGAGVTYVTECWSPPPPAGESITHSEPIAALLAHNRFFISARNC